MKKKGQTIKIATEKKNCTKYLYRNPLMSGNTYITKFYIHIYVGWKLDGIKEPTIKMI